jgi:hypothetical protein
MLGLLLLIIFLSYFFKKIIYKVKILICTLFSLFLTGTILAQDTSKTKMDVDSAYSKVEKEAEFPGGIREWSEYIQRSLNGNIPIVNKAPVGTYTVIIQFIISRDGTIKDATAQTHFGYGMEAEAIRVIENGPNWIPAYQRGHNVNAYRLQPITFVVQ